MKRQQKPDTRMLTMQETMDYLTEQGFPCKSRNTFYRMVKDFSIPYVVTNPHGTYEIRRFPLDGLQKAIEIVKSSSL